MFISQTDKVEVWQKYETKYQDLLLEPNPTQSKFAQNLLEFT